MLKADQPYVKEFLRMIAAGEPISLVGTKKTVTIEPKEGKAIAKMLFPNGNINKAEIGSVQQTTISRDNRWQKNIAYSS